MVADEQLDKKNENSDEKKSEEDTSEQPQEKKTPKVVREIYLDKNIKIFPFSRLEHLDKGSIKAYAAEGLNRTNNNLFALVCDRALTPRRIAAQKYVNIKNLSLVRLVTSGKVQWPDPEEEKFCFIYELTMGKTLLEGDVAHPALRKKPEDIIDSIVNPMIDLLQDLANKDLVHGEIWPGNIFYGGAGVGDKIMLGECLSMPPSANLPALYEPVERALADPTGKGTGSLADDIYSFGVTLAVILRKATPEAGLSEDEIIERKIEKGSYATFLKDDRFSGAILELLRGLLYDDPNQRWTLEDIHAWRDGRRLSPKQSSPRIKANRPVIMDNMKYVRPERLAKNFVKNPLEAAKIIENDELMQWIDRAIEDKSLKTRLEGVIKESNNLDQGKDFNHRLCVAVSSVLFPDIPVLYKDLRFNPRGFGKYLTQGYITQEDPQPYVEVMRNYFPSFIIRSQKKHDMSALNSKFDGARNFIKQTKVNMGIERCIYFFNPECQCLSPLVEKYYPITAEDLAEALEDVCSKSNPRDIFDRHIISFITSKSKKNIEPYISDLSAKDAYRQFLGRLRVLATLQKRSRMKPFPALAEWFYNNMDPLLERFHDTSKHKILKTEIKKMIPKGDLARIATLFDARSLFENDLNNFYLAMQAYQNLEREQKKIAKRIEDTKTFGRESGAQVASFISLVLAAGVIVLTAYVHFLKDGF